MPIRNRNQVYNCFFISLFMVMSFGCVLGGEQSTYKVVLTKDRSPVSHVQGKYSYLLCNHSFSKIILISIILSKYYCVFLFSFGYGVGPYIMVFIAYSWLYTEITSESVRRPYTEAWIYGVGFARKAP